MSTLEARLRAGLQKMPNGCWEWQGYRLRRYGRIAIAHSRAEPTHRVAYKLWVGPIPDGLFVCHSCDNPPCCNPAHLWLGTSRENTLDAAAKGRLAKPRRATCKHGHLLEAENLYIRPDNGKRMCKQCGKDAAQRTYERRWAAGLTVRGHTRKMAPRGRARHYAGSSEALDQEAADAIEEVLG